MRLLNLVVAILLIAAAAWVYKIKFEATVEAEQVGKLRAEIAHEREAAAALRAEAAKLDNPARIQALAQRHLTLQLLDGRQMEPVDKIPMRPAPPEPPVDPIADILAGAGITGSIGRPAGSPAAASDTGSAGPVSSETVPDDASAAAPAARADAGTTPPTTGSAPSTGVAAGLPAGLDALVPASGIVAPAADPLFGRKP
ncbi:hypothetical protein A33M_0310 [Rhodovulum sp. PH10]|uniref:cell division protein FtsL n=1 Tax=Rhodovulum sp. PH10 TaxID=1187851 RepID=UPI00027C2166|nr:hypothetical protein [Rhodovulum sp. PH10]EJW13151.1 hypothetical protein A33M_0310 [Rhodovulum sp. PH10]